MERTLGGVMEKSLYDAAAMGDTKTISDLLKKDPLLLDRVSFTSPNKSPLHIATMYGRLSFVQAILDHNPNLAEELDSQQSSALHIASAKGYEHIASELLSAAPDMCLSRDCQGKTPLHIAVVKGHGSVLEELVRVVPLAAREKMDRGVGLLHLCVKHKQLEAMKFLLVNFSDMINDRDDDGDTVLHMAVRDNQIEMVEYLLKMSNIDVNAKNSKGQTASQSDILKQNQNSQLRKILKLAISKSNKGEKEPAEKWRNSLMVVATLIATMAFQAGVTPPGGVWQDSQPDSKGNHTDGVGQVTHIIGEAIMGQYPKAYKLFILCNSLAFVLSLGTILLLISGLSFRRKLFSWILRVIMWLTITSMGMTYLISTIILTPYNNGDALSQVLFIVLTVWFVVMVILLVGNSIRLLKIDRWFKNKWINVCQGLRNSLQVKHHVTLGQAHV